MKQTLRIKKVYYDAIKRGEKTKEYRNNTEFYRSRLLKEPKITHMVFFFSQSSSERLTKRVKKIRIIETPDFLKATKLPFTKTVFEISLE